MKKKTKALCSFLFALLFILQGIPVCQAAVTLEERTLEDVLEKYRQNPFPFSAFQEVEYDIEPSAVFPYNAGRVKHKYLQEALDCVNFIRYLAGLPDDITLDQTYIDYTQHGAVLLAALNQLTHHPSQPADMPDDFYQTAYQGPSESNCGAGHRSILHSIQSYMDDSDPTNIDRVGHRRWLLNPSMQKIGFGYYKRYTDTYVFDRSRKDIIQLDYLCWPAKNYMPLEMMDSQLAWSVNLGNDYDNPDDAAVMVRLTRRNDKKTWEFSKNSSFTGTNHYFYINNVGYGMSKCIIFRPDIEKYNKDDIFDVSISGIYKNGAACEINYSVQLFRLQEPAPVKASLSAGTYLNEAEVAFSSEHPDTVILYTTADEIPNIYYHEPIRIDQTTTFKVCSMINYEKGEVSTYHYNIEPVSQWAVQDIGKALAMKIIPDSMQKNYQQNITRADFCKLAVNFLAQKNGKTIPAILKEKDVQLQRGIFTDTSDEEILAANALGIVNGVGNGAFKPDGLITRQEAAVMLMRTAAVLGAAAPDTTGVSFADSDTFAGWAKPAIAFVSTLSDKGTGQKVMGGVGNNLFSPLGTYTREQSYVTMLRLFSAME